MSKKMPLTPGQVALIKATVPVLKEHGNAITSAFYCTLLKENPDLNNIFNETNQANNHQPAALAASLYAYASHIDDLGALSPAVEKICQKHASLYIQPEQYEIVATYLLRAMGDILGTALTPEVLEAWGAAYWQLAHIMINRESELYTQTQGWTTWRAFRIAKKIPESSQITSFYLEPVSHDSLPRFLPGQYISVMLPVPELGYKQARQYSLSATPNSSYYRISVKKEPGAPRLLDCGGDVFHPGYISNLLHEQKNEGDEVLVSHPAGEFFYDSDSEAAGADAEAAEIEPGPIVLISAGVGMTPMISILDTIVSQNQTRNQDESQAAVKKTSRTRVSFIHATRDSSVRAFGPHIRSIVAAQKESNRRSDSSSSTNGSEEGENEIKATFFTKNPRPTEMKGEDYTFAGRISFPLLDEQKDLFLHDPKTKYFVCGPASFMRDVKAELVARRVDGEKIRMETFGAGGV